MKKRIINLLLLLMFLAGAAFLLYPSISDAWNRHRNKELISTYSSAVDDLEQTESERELKEAQEFNKQHTKNLVWDVFAKDQMQQSNKTYDMLLDPSGDGTMGYIEIPKISLKLAIYHGTSVETLEKGVGHLEGTSLPIGGEGTHAVLSAHRGLPSAKLFTDLDQMEVGDKFYITVMDQVNAYEVDQILTVLPSETESLAIEKGKDYVTLLTCTPYAVNTHRLLVRGHRIPYGQEQKQQVQRLEKKEVENTRWIIISIVVCVVIGGSIIFIDRKKKGKKADHTKA